MSFSNPPYILGKTKEDLLVYGSGDHASACIYLVSHPYSATVVELREVVTTRFGIRLFEEKPKASFEEIFSDMAAQIDNVDARSLWRSEWATSTRKLREAGFLTEGFKEARMQSGYYNVYPERDASSVLNVRLWDAADLFGSDGTIIFIYRTDTAKEWWQKNPHSLFSFWYQKRIDRYVTRTEIAVIESWLKKENLPSTFFAMGANPIPSYSDVWIQIRNWFWSRAQGTTGDGNNRGRTPTFQ